MFFALITFLPSDLLICSLFNIINYYKLYYKIITNNIQIFIKLLHFLANIYYYFLCDFIILSYFLYFLDFFTHFSEFF